MKTAIVYCSRHLQNTKQLLKALAQRYDITLVNIDLQVTADFSVYDCIGFASGVAFNKLYPELLAFAGPILKLQKQVFFIYTCGRLSGSGVLRLSGL